MATERRGDVSQGGKSLRGEDKNQKKPQMNLQKSQQREMRDPEMKNKTSLRNTGDKKRGRDL